MKITQLRFKNLNSIVGEWIIDFTTPEYVSDGIFAITGPTGAGKSTILDAICLALYGCTPRLSNISATTNEIMSRHTSECFAEVVFETHEGCFRAFWSQHRSRNKADGALQTPKREISEVNGGKILANQIKTTNELIEQRTGMDFNRFTQSMMLAQGGFAAFLQASGNERAPILEQITGTEIYSNISKYVYEKQKDERNKLDNLLTENKGIIIIAPEEEKDIKREIEEKSNKEKTLSQKKDQLEKAISWLNLIDTLKTELKQINEDEKKLSQIVEEFKPKQSILKNAIRASALDADFAGLYELRIQQKKDSDNLKLFMQQTPELTKNKEYDRIMFDNYDKELNVKNKEWDALLELTRKVRLIDQNIDNIHSVCCELDKQIQQLNIEKRTEINKKSGLEMAISKLKTELDVIRIYQTENQFDSTLASELTGIIEKIQSWSKAVEEQVFANENLVKEKQSLPQLEINIQSINNELINIKEQHQKITDLIKQNENEISHLLKGDTFENINEKKDQLLIKIANLKKIADFGTERSLLKDGEACPLCGSMHHPWALGNIPQPNDAETDLANLIIIINKITAIQKKLNELQKNERTYAECFIQIKNKLELQQQQKNHIENLIQKLNNEYSKHTNVANTSFEIIKQALKTYNLELKPEHHLKEKELTQMLVQRKNNWLAHEKRQNEIIDIIRNNKHNVNVCETIIKSKDEYITAKSIELESQKSKLLVIKKERTAMFGERNTEDEENNLKAIVKQADTNKTKAQQKLQISTQKLSDNKNIINELNSKIQIREDELNKREMQFKELLKQYSFADEDSFIANRLPHSERELLNEEAKKIETKKTELELRKKDRTDRLSIETSKKLTDEDIEKLTIEHSIINVNLNDLIQEIGAIKQKLKFNEEAKVKGEKIQQQIAMQQVEFNRWNNLNALIGSADGKKYRNFAQGLTLEIMVSFANHQLTKLSDRYLLVRDANEPLELNVIDNYQAGEIRSTKNLSGGESFIVSLALALGLSRMSSRKVKVDSLFLDEGFGTLDEESLETALGTLANLRQDGKIIGIISHVGALKDRINTKISINPLREGKSVIVGPGCKQVI
ncbi:MAG: AAA family ATPase [Marinilabiliaceae bacterium]|nr:AAA family ATPase [Marinilabiliaceae bacterium]